jgi:hypothetical protein
VKTHERNGPGILCFAVVLVLFIPSTVFALGDPFVLFSMLGIAVLHAVLAGFILLARSCTGFRTPLLAIYLSVAVMAWLWGMDYLGPNFGEMYMRLTVGPVITFICLNWLLICIKRKK